MENLVIKNAQIINEGLIQKRDVLIENGLIVEIAPSIDVKSNTCLLYTSPSPRDQRGARMPSSA